jgi:hypothetical protein
VQCRDHSACAVCWLGTERVAGVPGLGRCNQVVHARSLFGVNVSVAGDKCVCVAADGGCMGVATCMCASPQHGLAGMFRTTSRTSMCRARYLLGIIQSLIWQR